MQADRWSSTSWVIGLFGAVALCIGLAVMTCMRASAATPGGPVVESHDVVAPPFRCHWESPDAQMIYFLGIKERADARYEPRVGDVSARELWSHFAERCRLSDLRDLQIFEEM